MKPLFYLIFPIQVIAQSGLKTNDYFPAVNSRKPQQIQVIKITDGDTTEYVTHKYEYEELNNKKYLISSTYDSDGLITSLLKEEITSKGLRYSSSKTYLYDENNQVTEFLVKGKKKITFPFKTVERLKDWTLKTKHSYDNKVIVKSKVSYVGTEEVEFHNRKVIALKFHREAKATYKKEYEKETVEYEYDWYFLEGLGMYKYVRKGDTPFHGEVVKSE